MFSPLLLLLGLLGFVGCQLASDKDPGIFYGGAFVEDYSTEEELSSDGAIVDDFLNSIRLAIVDSDKETMSRLIADEFVYGGCKKKYNKTQAISFLTTMSDYDGLNIKQRRSRFVNGTAEIEFDVAVFNIGEPTAQRFYIHKRHGRFVLLRGWSGDCPWESNYYQLKYDCRMVAESVISSLSKALIAQDSAAVENLFGPNFWLQMCGYKFLRDSFLKLLGNLRTYANLASQIISIRQLPSKENNNEPLPDVCLGDFTVNVMIGYPTLPLNFNGTYFLTNKNNEGFKIAYGGVRLVPR